MTALLQLLNITYASVGIIATIGYLPTIKDLFHKKMSANISSYIMWTFCAGITFLYSMIKFSDILLKVVTATNFACCAIILGMALWLKIRKH